MKEYLEFNEKTRLIDNIVESCVINGELDVMQREIAKVIYITLFYEGDERFIKDESGELRAAETYDFLMRDNAFSKEIQSKIPGVESRRVERLINEAIEEKIRQSSTISGLLKKLSELDIKGTLSQFKDLDMKKMQEVSKLVALDQSK